jgi:trans-2,3-dihydro-3-hydroxyanthranilate isomerase
MSYPFRILNVFTSGARLSGNPLCVFEDARGLDASQMQAIARQFNLSETSFVFPPERGGSAHVRIFTPALELPFAGHPTLGTAHVVRSRTGAARVTLEMGVGLVDVRSDGDRWTLQTAGGLETREGDRSVVKAFGLDDAALADTPLWVDTGAEHLIVPLCSADHVRRARANVDGLEAHAFSKKRGGAMALIFAPVAENGVLARFFFVANGAVLEDPATGSACANLGGYPSRVDERCRSHAGCRRGKRCRDRRSSSSTSMKTRAFTLRATSSRSAGARLIRRERLASC